jgi:hypothetical protein
VLDNLGTDMNCDTTDKLIPLKLNGWVLIGCGLLISTCPQLQTIGTHPPLWFVVLLVAGVALGILLIVWGVCELRGIMSRRRWRNARSDVARLSTPGTVRWHHDREELYLPIICAAFSAPPVVLTPVVSLLWVTSLAVLATSLYFLCVLLINTREVVCRGNDLAYASRPFPHPFDRSECAAAYFVFLGIGEGGTFELLAQRRRLDERPTKVATIASIELATTVAISVQTLLLAQVPEPDRQEVSNLLNTLNERLLKPTSR